MDRSFHYNDISLAASLRYYSFHLFNLVLTAEIKYFPLKLDLRLFSSKRLAFLVFVITYYFVYSGRSLFTINSGFFFLLFAIAHLLHNTDCIQQFFIWCINLMMWSSCLFCWLSISLVQSSILYFLLRQRLVWLRCLVDYLFEFIMLYLTLLLSMKSCRFSITNINFK